NDTITFTVSGVVDTGGEKRVDCVVNEEVPPVTPTYTWELTIPPDYPPPLPPLSGSGSTASVVAKAPGTYSCTLMAEANRECEPSEHTIGPETGKAVRIRVDSITFSGTDMRAVSRDDGSGVYPTPHWKDNSSPLDDDNDDVGDHNIPVAYPRNTRMYLSATFVVEPADGLTGAVIVTGEATGAGLPYRFEDTVSVSGATVTISNVAADRLLVNEIHYYDPLTIHWSITPGAGDPLNCSIPDTTHRVYVTLAAPDPGSLYETVVHLGCRSAAGYASESETMAAIWSDFTDRVVQRKPKDGLNTQDNVQMKYWNPPGTASQTMEGMLATGNGTCVAWSQLFQAILHAQGIGSAGIVEVTPIYTDDPTQGGGRGGMLVKNWSFLQPGTAPPSCSPFTHLETETTDNPGAPAQDNSDPPGAFLNHFIIRCDGQWYDPSYGNGPFASDLAWENASIDGYRKLCASLPGDVRKQNDATLVEMQFLSP
ncbi:MAG: hypothetical protein JSU86_07010, partial [Phycisphaerales bacterium]